MTMKTLLGAAAVAILLSGCSDSAPSGSLESTGHALAIGEGSNNSVTFVQEVRPASQIGDPVQDLLCWPETAPVGDPVGALTCVDAETQVSLHVMGVADSGQTPYTFAWTGAGGMLSLPAPSTTGEGAMMMYNINTTFDEDLSGMYDTFGMYWNDILIASAPNNGAWTISTNLTQLSFSAEWESDEITLTISGAEPGVPYVGWLVTVDEAGAKEHVESFAITGDETTYVANDDIDAFQEVHIHIGSTSLNAAIGTI